jgi:hypothetical protein
MLDFRTLALGLGVFAATFLVGWWLDIGNLASRSMAKPVVERPPLTPQPSASPQAVVHTPPKTPERKGLVDDKVTRDAVIAWSKSYQRPTCNQDVRWGYTKAATNYAKMLMRAAGCNNFPRCPMSMAQLERVWRANRSSADMPVAEAMAAANAAGGLNERAFRGDVGRAVRVIAGRDFDPGPAPICSSQRARKSWSVRYRRR